MTSFGDRIIYEYISNLEEIYWILDDVKSANIINLHWWYVKLELYGEWEFKSLIWFIICIEVIENNKLDFKKNMRIWS